MNFSIFIWRFLDSGKFILDIIILHGKIIDTANAPGSLKKCRERAQTFEMMKNISCENDEILSEIYFSP